MPVNEAQQRLEFLPIAVFIPDASVLPHEPAQDPAHDRFHLGPFFSQYCDEDRSAVGLMQNIKRTLQDLYSTIEVLV